MPKWIKVVILFYSRKQTDFDNFIGITGHISQQLLKPGTKKKYKSCPRADQITANNWNQGQNIVLKKRKLRDLHLVSTISASAQLFWNKPVGSNVECLPHGFVLVLSGLHFAYKVYEMLHLS